ncbi:MAG: hypothetical protein VKN72_27815 [Nostocales cyanobacterium 94392]|nr:hypothetical protein [Nostocales cyanobacterium 94392]
MSYQFSFSQAFTSYNFVESKLVPACRQKNLLQEIRAVVRIEYCRLIEMILLTGMGQFQTQVCQILGCFQPMLRYSSGSACTSEVGKCCHPPIGRPKIANNQYIQRLRKSLTQTSSDYRSCDIFNHYMVIYLCKYFLKKKGIFKNQRVCGVQCCLIGDL